MIKQDAPKKAKWFDCGEGYICPSCWFRSVLRYKNCPKCGVKMKNGYVKRKQDDKTGTTEN